MTDISGQSQSATNLARRVEAQLRGYWEAVRPDPRDIPARADIDPRGIAAALEYSFILERVAPGVARFRLAGLHLNDLLGMEVRGMPLGALFPADARKAGAEAVETVFARPAIVSADLASPAGFGKPALDARMLLLPLRSDFGETSRALGCIVAQGEIGRAPRRFGIRATRIETLVTAPQRAMPAAAASAARFAPRPAPLSSSLLLSDALRHGFDEPGAPAPTQPPVTPVSVTPRPAPRAATAEARRSLFRVISTND